ncbi:hypothetical protein Pcinc_019394 [Petrolisthes cinctipes]|uniref:Uncharacterized protein n=1 Tax=Petrolisthes cinctipes TaxID=88211 RepID=A0AAE1KMR7_PETCI|nr:hypothetical protein Pcinc_019394 [Petrolisthes cinctipes]
MFLETGSVNDQPRSGIPHTRCGEENVETVEATFVQSQGLSIQRIALGLNISRASIQQMLRKDMWMYPYKIQVVKRFSSCAISEGRPFVDVIDSVR